MYTSHPPCRPVRAAVDLPSATASRAATAAIRPAELLSSPSHSSARPAGRPADSPLTPYRTRARLHPPASYRPLSVPRLCTSPPARPAAGSVCTDDLVLLDALDALHLDQGRHPLGQGRRGPERLGRLGRGRVDERLVDLRVQAGRASASAFQICARWTGPRSAHLEVVLVDDLGPLPLERLLDLLARLVRHRPLERDNLRR